MTPQLSARARLRVAGAFAVLVALWICPHRASFAGDAAQPFLVRDINVTPNLGGRESQLLGESIQLDSQRFLFAADGESGVELWISDGAAEGTSRLKVIRPGRRGSMPHSFKRLGDIVLFVADDGTHGDEFWRTDGTPEGTFMLADIRPGREGSQPRSFRIVGNRLFFVADDGVHGSELWRSDGTAEGTMLVKDIRPGPASSTPYPAAVMEIDNVPQEEHVEVLFPAMTRFAPTQQVLFFQADDGVTGLELWKTDGTEVGTVLVKDGYPGPRDATPTRLTVVDQLLYYAAEDGTHGQELWRSDGTPDGTYLVFDVTPGTTSSAPGAFTLFTDVLYFSASSFPSGFDPVQTRLWRSDGTATGTSIVRPEMLGFVTIHDPRYLIPTPFGWLAFSGEVFSTYLSNPRGREPCRSDGTFDGTMMIAELATGAASSHPRHFSVFADTLFFVANVSPLGFQLCTTDGTQAGTAPLHPVSAPTAAAPGPLKIIGEQMFFPQQADTGGRELWITDGTAGGTNLVKDLAHGSASSFPQALREHLQELVFEAHVDGTSIELWQSDGTEVGTRRLLKVRDEQADADPRFITHAADQVFFFADDGNGDELWVTGGTEASTVQVIELVPGPHGVRPRAMLALNEFVIWIDSPLSAPQGIWTSDGTPEGTMRLADALVDLACEPCHGAIARLGDAIVFAGPTPSGTHGVWITDGTLGGETLLIDMLGEPGDPIPDSFTACGDHVYFTAQSSTHSRWALQLMKTDGTAAGTVLVADLWADSNHAPTNLTAVGDTLFFIAGSGDAGRELWKSDGSAEGTVLVRDIRPGPEDSQIDWMTSVGDLLYFTADAADGAGQELWRSNGTPGGTVRVADIRPGPVGSWPKNLGVVGNRLFFTANDGVHGDELWKSDGTAAGTVLVKNIRPGAGSSIPDNFVQLSGVEIAVFTAFTDNDGMELWVTDGTEAGTFRISDIAPGSLSAHPQELILSGDLLYFQATDPSTGRELWAIDVSDIDGDGIPNLFDNCPLVYNPLQEDTNLNGRGDACDACPTRRGGDLNGDIVVSEQDLPLFVDALLYPHLLDDDGRCAADVNGDGEVNAQDIAAFVQHLTQPES